VPRPSQRLIAGVAAATFTALSVLSAAASEPTVTPETETLYISAGCPPSTPAGGTCTSTRWLGLTPGESTSNFLTSTTPVDEVLYRVDGEPNWRDYGSDSSLRAEGYPLRSEDPIRMTVTVAANVLAANATVHGRLEGTTADRKFVSLGSAEQVITVVADEETVTFEFDVPASLEGVTLRNLTAYVAVHGINAQGGYIDQQGGSTVELPYWRSAA
jgi:hypothetical protein